MEPKFQSSFIPKGPMAPAGAPTRLSHTSDRTLLGTLAVFVFTFALLLSLGVYGYQLYLKSNIGKMGGDLASARQSLQPETIQKISDLDGRIVSTKALLDKHVVLSPLFDYLEGATVRGIRFTDFDYEASDKGISVTLHGMARGYSTVALQSELLNAKDSPLRNIVFSNLNLDDKGNVIFVMKASVNPSIISYKNEVGTQTIEAPAATLLAPPPATSNSSSSASSTSQ